jgi:hypothetical protein
VKQEIAEEILALEAIYGEDFQLDSDGVGFALRVVPHPGDAQAGFTSVTLHVRCAVMGECQEAAASTGQTLSISWATA